jgi:hypothetical protein
MKTITRPQALALRNAEELPEELLTPADPLRGLLVIDARPNTLAALVRLGLAEEKNGQHVLTRAGYTVRAITDLPHYLPRLDTVASIVAAAAEEDALAAEEQKRPSDGTYYPAEAGARGWRDAVPLWFDGRRVSAIVENDGQDLYVFLGTETIYDGDMPTGITGDGDVNTWVRQYATGYAWAAEYRTLWSYRNHAGYVVGPYSDAEFAATGKSAEAYCRGIVDTAGAGEVIRTDRTPEHFETAGRNWTDVRTVVHVAGAPAPAAETAQDAPQDAPASLSGLPLPVVTTAELLALETARGLLPEGAQLISAQPVGSGLVIAYVVPGAFYTHAVDAYRPATPDETDPENVDALPVGSLVLADSYGGFSADDVPAMVATVSRDLAAQLAASTTR